jgi:hypothetical protein
MVKRSQSMAFAFTGHTVEALWSTGLSPAAAGRQLLSASRSLYATEMAHD